MKERQNFLLKRSYMVTRRILFSFGNSATVSMFKDTTNQPGNEMRKD